MRYRPERAETPHFPGSVRVRLGCEARSAPRKTPPDPARRAPPVHRAGAQGTGKRGGPGGGTVINGIGGQVGLSAPEQVYALDAHNNAWRMYQTQSSNVSTGVTTEAVSVYGDGGAGQPSNIPNEVPQCNAFWQGMQNSAAAVNYSEGMEWTNGYVWDSDFYDPDLTGKADDDTHNFDANTSENAIAMYCGHGAGPPCLPRQDVIPPPIAHPSRCQADGPAPLPAHHFPRCKPRPTAVTRACAGGGIHPRPR